MYKVEWSRHHYLSVLICLIAAAILHQIFIMPETNKERLSPEDPNSYARPDVAKVTHIFLGVKADFEQKVLDGHVVLTVEKVASDATHVILDSRKLIIHDVTDEATGQKLEFSLAPEGYVGSKLEIALPTSKDKQVKIKVRYTTSPECTALQWLPPSQTAGKTHPYVFSQCQAIHCRSMLPCQDSPSVKMPYTAEITAPADLTVLMSAIRQGEPASAHGGQRTHRFEQKVPIQSYLIAIAAGNIESRKIGPRSHVWSEKEYVEQAAFDFSETENMLKTAEDLCGPYVWGIYDILVLPPSFPFGGMENPCLTFATPTLLAGDKSLAGVVAHEIAHSWTGNLVTNKNFEHFWLNEGFTVFTERKIIGRLRGNPHRDFAAIGGWKDLSYEIEVLGKDNQLTDLVVDLNGVDPDDAFSTVPYEKGSTFLWYLEDTVGGADVFEPFLRAYYDHFKYKSIDSYQFKAFFLDYFKDKDLSIIQWDEWFNKPGMPIYKPNFDQSLAKVCADLKQKWVEWKETDACPFKSGDLGTFSSGQKIEFLAQLLEEQPLSVAKLSKLEELYHFNAVNNSEIKFRWIRLGLRGQWKDAVPRAVQMVTEQGRMKFLRPLYRDLYNWDATKETALETFKKNKSSMMHVAVQGLEIDLKLKSEK